MKLSRMQLTLVAGFIGAVMALPAMAQNGGAGGGGGGGGGGGFGGGGRRGGGGFGGGQQTMDAIKTRLEAKDDEWAAIQPRLEKVQTLQRETQNANGMRALFGGGGGGRGGRRGGGGGGGFGGAGGAPADTSDVAQKTQALQALLDNKDAKPEEIKDALTALRTARAKARDDLKGAQKSLTELLTQRQEAILVTLGMLE